MLYETLADVIGAIFGFAPVKDSRQIRQDSSTVVVALHRIIQVRVYIHHGCKNNRSLEASSCDDSACRMESIRPRARGKRMGGQSDGLRAWRARQLRLSLSGLLKFCPIIKKIQTACSTSHNTA